MSISSSESSVAIVTDDGREVRVDPYTWQRTTYAIEGSTGELTLQGWRRVHAIAAATWRQLVPVDPRKPGRRSDAAIVEDLDRGAFANSQAYVALLARAQSEGTVARASGSAHRLPREPPGGTV